MAVLLTIRADFLPFVLKPAHHLSKLPVPSRRGIVVNSANVRTNQTQ